MFRVVTLGSVQTGASAIDALLWQNQKILSNESANSAIEGILSLLIY
jgi:hypothetical protein